MDLDAGKVLEAFECDVPTEGLHLDIIAESQQVGFACLEQIPE